MEDKLQVNNQLLDKGERKYQRIRLLLYSEDFDFAHSFSLYFRKDYHKIITVNDRETLLQIVEILKPEIIILDNLINESLLAFVKRIKEGSPKTKIFVFTSQLISQQEIIKKLSREVNKIFYQPIELSEFNQILNFYTAD